MRTFWIIVILGLILGGGYYGWKRMSVGPVEKQYRSEKIILGDLLLTINATGTVVPEEVVDVGAQVGGRILEFGKDKQGKNVDYGSEVSKGMVLARIDDTLYQSEIAKDEALVGQGVAQLKQAEAQLANAQARMLEVMAGIAQAEAESELSEVNLAQTKRVRDRALRLSEAKAMAQSEYDQAISGYESAQASSKVAQSRVRVAQSAVGVQRTVVSQAEAGVEFGQAAVRQAQASLDKSRRNLGYCTISSPVGGIIIDRRVNIGQTVVASLNAPSLFLIAKDLRRMQVWVPVNEADIGNIHAGQRVTFKVDACLGEEFVGTVGKVRLNASVSQNVVTYIVEVETDNTAGKLLPYLTANVAFEVEHRKQVLLVSNGALRWRPSELSNGEDPEVNKEAGESLIWVRRDGDIRAVMVRVGKSDGIKSEISGTGIEPGLEVIVGEVATSAGGAKETVGNPFIPKMPRRRP